MPASFNRAQIESILTGLQLEQPRLYDALQAMLTGLDKVILDVEGNTSGVGSVDTLLSSGRPGSYLQTNVNPDGKRASTNLVIWRDPLDVFDYTEDFLSIGDIFIARVAGTGLINQFASSGLLNIGLRRLTTQGTINSRAELVCPQDNVTTLVDPTLISYFCAVLEFKENTAVQVMFGFVQDADTFPTGGTDGVLFRLDTGVDTQLRFVTRSAGVETAAVVHTPTLNTFYRYEVFVADGFFKVYLNGTFVLAQNTNVPASGTTGVLTFGIKNTAAANKRMTVDYCRLIVPGLAR